MCEKWLYLSLTLAYSFCVDVNPSRAAKVGGAKVGDLATTEELGVWLYPR